MQIRRSLRLSVCAFYIRVEALYTLKHHPAESVTSDFFIADPNSSEVLLKLVTHTFAVQTAVRSNCSVCTFVNIEYDTFTSNKPKITLFLCSCQYLL